MVSRGLYRLPKGCTGKLAQGGWTHPPLGARYATKAIPYMQPETNVIP
jgi:hypothetical protein